MEIQLWRELLDPYQLAVDELLIKFNHMISEHRNMGLYSPIESVIGRVISMLPSSLTAISFVSSSS